MTTAKRIKNCLITYLMDNRPDESIAIIDASQRELATLPALAVAVSSIAPHSEALRDVERAQVELTLRIHAGDEDETVDIDSWTDQIESALNDPSAIVALGEDTGLYIYHWIYSGATQSFNDAALDTTFTAECLCMKSPPTPDI